MAKKLLKVTLLKGCWIEAENPLRPLCDGFVADLQRIARTTVASSSQSRQPTSLKV